jgi:hypothetical protein
MTRLREVLESAAAEPRRAYSGVALATLLLTSPASTPSKQNEQSDHLKDEPEAELNDTPRCAAREKAKT